MKVVILLLAVGLHFETWILIGCCDVWRPPSTKECYFWAEWPLYDPMLHNEPRGTRLRVPPSRAAVCCQPASCLAPRVHVLIFFFFKEYPYIYWQFLPITEKATYTPVCKTYRTFPWRNVKNSFGGVERANDTISLFSLSWSRISLSEDFTIVCARAHHWSLFWATCI
jgi:hypothetical protein